MLVCGHVWWAVWIGLDHGRVCVGLSGLGWPVGVSVLGCLDWVEPWRVCVGLSGLDWPVGVSVVGCLEQVGPWVCLSVRGCLDQGGLWICLW